MNMLSIAVDEQFLFLVGKTTKLYKPYDAKRASNCRLLLVLSR